MFKDELFAGAGPVTIWLNSPGGDCIAASQIYSMLMDYKGNVTVKIDGIAASAASVIAMAGTKVLMAPTALMMIHNPATTAFGDHADMRKAIEMMDDTTWMNAKKAIELGFADGLLEDAKNTPAAEEAYSFSARAVEAAIINKIAAKAKPVAPQGRSVDELRKQLHSIKNYI